MRLPSLSARLSVGVSIFMGHKQANKLSIKGNIAWNTVGSVFYQGCLWLMTVLVVRLSNDYQNSGCLAFAMSIGNIYTALGTYTVRTFQVADVDNTYSASNYVGFRLITVLGALAICGTYGLVISPSIATLHAVLSFLVFKADEAFVNVLYGCDQKSMRLDYVGQSQIIRGLLVVSLFTLGMQLTHSLVFSIALLTCGCFFVTLFFDVRKTSGLADSLVPRIDKARATRLFRTLLPTVIGNVVAGLVTSLARQYFGIAYGEEALGIYASVATPCVIIQVLAQNLYTPMLGPIAKLKSTGDERGARRKSIELLVAVIGIALLLSAPLIAFSKPILGSLYGETILPYVGVLPPALLVTTGIASLFVITDLLIVYGKLRQTLTINLVALATMAISLIPLISHWYMNGLNMSLIIAYSTASIYGLATLFRN